MQRRSFLSAAFGTALGAAAEAERPNILWLTCEDMSPLLGCYGDKYSTSPNIDRFATRSLRYTTAWSNAPVCAPARTTIISGIFPPATGSEHMRSETKLPDGMKMFPQYLREAGYYCTNNSKEDYNLIKPAGVWDDSSNKAHWRNRKPNQPFFAIFNDTITHESQVRKRPHDWQHDLTKVPIPSYYPDTKEVREDLTQNYDNVTTMDRQVGKLLDQLSADGLAENTIVFFYADHGTGIPRSKRTPFNSGLQVPLLIHIPEKWKALRPPDYRSGGVSSRPVSFVDLAPTVLSLAGIKPPAYHQGFAFLGQYPAPEQPYVYGFRGRMDERYDLMRSVRDQRYVYVRNYMPHRVYGQFNSYMFETPTTRVWKKMFDEGKLNAVQKQFWETKAPELLFDLDSDKDEVKNLAGSPAHQAILARLRRAQQAHAKRIRDIGFLPENEIHARAATDAPYDLGHDDARYPFDRIFAMAEAASSLKPALTPSLRKGLSDTDSAVRYWAALGFLMRGAEAVQAHSAALRAALADAAPAVRIAAGEALGRYGNEADTAQAAQVLIELADANRNPFFVTLLALNALDYMGPRAAPFADRIKRLPTSKPGTLPKLREYIPRLHEKTVEDIG